MTDETREAIYQYFLKPYLTAQASTSAGMFACPLFSCEMKEFLVPSCGGKSLTFLFNLGAALYHFAKKFLCFLVVVCDAGSFQNWREVNFGVFFYFFQLGEILTLNENFTLVSLVQME